MVAVNCVMNLRKVLFLTHQANMLDVTEVKVGRQVQDTSAFKVGRQVQDTGRQVQDTSKFKVGRYFQDKTIIYSRLAHAVHDSLHFTGMYVG